MSYARTLQVIEPNDEHDTELNRSNHREREKARQEQKNARGGGAFR